MPLDGIALDAASVRTYDKFGRLHIARTPISKAAVNPYYGREIPGYEQLGLDANRVYQLLRDPSELEAGASTFARNQLLVKHTPVTANDCQRDVIAGTIGSNVEFVYPYLWADVTVWDNEAIAGIETDTVREFSCAYGYQPDMTPGTFEGVAFDGRMTKIHGNHLAVVESGRAGSDVLAADEDTMKTTKLGKALLITLGGLSPKLAQDSALPALVGKARKKDFNKAEISGKLIAMDSELDAAKLDTTLDALLALDADKEDDPKPKIAEDDDDEDDEDEKDDDSEEVKERKRKRKAAREMAQDKAISRAVEGVKVHFREADEARRLVRAVVGDVIAQDSAAEIYGFALDHMGVARAGVTGVPALKALFSAVQARSALPATPTIAQDAAGLATRFPNATRFGQR